MLTLLLLTLAGPLSLSDGDGKAHAPLALAGKKAVVILSVMPDCPISNYYAPEIKRLCKDYEAKGVAFFLVHGDPDVTAAAARAHAKEYALPCPALLDPKHALLKMAGLTMAPEVAVFAPGGAVVYRGRIDDVYLDYGKRRAAPTKRDLRDALDAVLAGKKVTTPTTKAIGCFLPEPKK